LTALDSVNVKSYIVNVKILLLVEVHCEDPTVYPVYISFLSLLALHVQELDPIVGLVTLQTFVVVAILVSVKVIVIIKILVVVISIVTGAGIVIEKSVLVVM
jgi:hypothetical protein